MLNIVKDLLKTGALENGRGGYFALFQNDGTYADKNKIYKNGELVVAQWASWLKEENINVTAVKVEPKEEGKEAFLSLRFYRRNEDGTEESVSGVLFKNPKYEEGSSQPILSGTIDTLGGKEGRESPKIYIGAWLKTAKTSGKKYYSCSVSEFEKKNEGTSASSSAPTDDLDDQIPF